MKVKIYTHYSFKKGIALLQNQRTILPYLWKCTEKKKKHTTVAVRMVKVWLTKTIAQPPYITDTKQFDTEEFISYQGRQYRLPFCASAQYMEADYSEKAFRIPVFIEHMLEDFNAFISIIWKCITLLLMEHGTEAKL